MTSHARTLRLDKSSDEAHFSGRLVGWPVADIERHIGQKYVADELSKNETSVHYTCLDD